MGRKQADILLDDPKVSSVHLEIRREGPQFRLTDLGSTNGTFVNRQPIQSIILTDQDVVEVGLSTLCFFSDIRDFQGPLEDWSGISRGGRETQTKNSQSSGTRIQPAIELKIIKGAEVGKKIELRKSHILIGKEGADLTLNDQDVASSHALIEVLSKSLVYLRDLETTNGSFVNGEKKDSHKLRAGDKIQLGSTVIEFQIPSHEENS